MKQLVALCALLWASSGLAAQDIYGEWWTPGFNARVLIYPCDAKACGKVTWLWEETPADIADKKPLTGRLIFTGLARSSNNRWDGRIYNPEDGRSYSSNIQLTNEVTLEVNGCFLMFCKRQVWRRVDPTHCPPVAPALGIEPGS